ncbi:MAG TPA: hypothetical protein VER39_12280 [Nocardioidaceae bacterium]|nr:hypothetical protein [Nocardioidaceae bacterium]
MDTRPLARLAVVSAAASGVLVLVGHLDSGDAPRVSDARPAIAASAVDPVTVPAVRSTVAPEAGPVAESAPATAAVQPPGGARARLEQALSRLGQGVERATTVTDLGPPVDESSPHTHLPDPDKGGPVPASSMVGVLDGVDDLGPLHVDPMPPGRSVDDPTDTETLLERAGVEPRWAANGGPTTARAAGPPGTPNIPGLTSHVAPSCSGTGTDGNRVQVLYVHEEDTPSRYSTFLPAFRNEVANVDDAFAVSASQTGGERRVRWVHDADCRPVIKSVTVPNGALGSDFDSTIRAVEALGHNQASRKYLMFADANAFCGIGSMYDDPSPVDNDNDGRAASYSRVDSNCWFSGGHHSTAAHELVHNLGGVQPTAPHPTKYGHCFDDWDLMCYDDGSGIPMQTVCASERQEYLLDCNHDDYFHTSPPAGSFLAKSWNTARSSFLDSVVTSLPPPDVSVSAAANSVLTGQSVRFTATSSKPVSWTWSTSATGAACTLTPRTAGAADLVCPATVSGTVTVTATATQAGASSTGSGQASVTVTRAAAPTAQLTAPASATPGQAFPVSVTTGGAAPFGYSWSAATCSVSAPAAASTTVACPGGTTIRDVTVSVRVTQADGQSVQVSRAVRVPAAVAPAPRTTSWTAPTLVSGVVSARLRDQAGVALPNRPVTLQVKWSGTTTWGTALQLSTNSTGTAAVRVSASRAGWFRFVKPSDPAYLASVSPAVYVKVTTQLRMSAATGNRLVGTLRTSNGAPVAGVRVTLQRRAPSSSRWLPVATLRTTAQGRVSQRVTPARRTSYRWSYVGGAAHLQSRSTQVAVR